MGLIGPKQHELFALQLTVAVCDLGYTRASSWVSDANL